jgi:excinuclease UvrABC nuclease subunit
MVEKSPQVESVLATLPATPGVYVFRDGAGAVLYVGKARSLRARVRSYWSNRPGDHRMLAHVPEVASIEIERTSSEARALEREGELIKALRPRYNVADREGRRSPHLRLTTGAYPALEVAWSPDDPGELYGPYRTASEARRVLRAAERLFAVRTCALEIPLTAGVLDRPCLLGELGRCLAPCVRPPADGAYERELEALRAFLRGDRRELATLLHRRMHEASRLERYEEAARLRDRIDEIDRLPVVRLRRRPHTASVVDTERAARALVSLTRHLELADAPRRIACFDVATLAGKATTGACGVAIDGIVTPREERTYALGDFDAPDDLRAHALLAARVVEGIRDGRFARPDLLIVDGAEGQLGSWVGPLGTLADPPALVGIAKEPDRLVRLDGETIDLPAHDAGLLLAGAVRDRAHRRCNRLHRIRRDRSLLYGSEHKGGARAR